MMEIKSIMMDAAKHAKFKEGGTVIQAHQLFVSWIKIFNVEMELFKKERNAMMEMATQEMAAVQIAFYREIGFVLTFLLMLCLSVWKIIFVEMENSKFLQEKNVMMGT